MLTDATLTFSATQDLTALAANTPTASTNVVDLSVSRDIGVADVPIFVLFPTLPTSGTGGATINVAIQTSADNSTWVTIEETGPQVLTSFTITNVYAFRGKLPVGVLRYLRISYTVSAVLTGGTASAYVGQWSRNKAYPRNFVA